MSSTPGGTDIGVKEVLLNSPGVFVEDLGVIAIGGTTTVVTQH